VFIVGWALFGQPRDFSIKNEHGRLLEARFRV
jgi:hypothetical protein